VSIHRFVVLADRVRGFDTREEAERYARANYPSVLCERRTKEDGSSELVELARHDFLYDAERGEWGIFLG
jgi:hypothetical protein